VSGSGFPVTAGSVKGNPGTAGFNNGFITKLDAAGSTSLISIVGFGGKQIALDTGGNIYAAGSFIDATPTTPGAFQAFGNRTNCFVSFIMAIPCEFQHIAKIDATGTKLIYGTFLTGQWGASTGGMAVDADGNVIVAGSTYSPDFPTTPSAYLPQYLFDPEP